MLTSTRAVSTFVGVVGVVLGALHGCVIDDPDHCANSGVLCGTGLICDPCTPSNIAPNGCVAVAEMGDVNPDVAGCQPGASASTSVGPTMTADTDPTVDTLTVDTLSVDTLSVDTLSVDTLSVDTLSVDTLAADSLQVDTLAVVLP